MLQLHKNEHINSHSSVEEIQTDEGRGWGWGRERERERREETQIDGVFREGVWGTQRTTHKRAGEDEDPHKVDVGGGTGSTTMQTDMSHSA